MTDVSMLRPVRVGSGHAVPGAARWLGLAAAPTFAIMALWTALSRGHPDMLCMAMQGASPMSGMTLMYLLMSAFHSSPWLKLIAGRGHGARGGPDEPLALIDLRKREESGRGARPWPTRRAFAIVRRSARRSACGEDL